MQIRYELLSPDGLGGWEKDSRLPLPYPPPSTSAFVRNQTENGLRCPSCIAAFTETCTASEEALCVGEETRCVAVSGLVQPGKGHLEFARRDRGSRQAQNWSLMLSDSKGESGSNDLGEKVAGADDPGLGGRSLAILPPAL